MFISNLKTGLEDKQSILVDDIFHISGDGKLAGVLEPNDGLCHMENNEYTHGLKNDYPSVSHINYVAKLNNFNLIFAVAATKDKKQYVKDLYQKLEGAIENSKITVVRDDSDDVVSSIRDNYNVSLKWIHTVCYDCFQLKTCKHWIISRFS